MRKKPQILSFGEMFVLGGVGMLLDLTGLTNLIELQAKKEVPKDFILKYCNT